ncbi:MAG TPA: carboxypeptidase-like regulatory domain-containing protein [Planctomycetota bacterium]|nr:carboxypeptidase-like regulatory domain-containing protein [Planctomycetota bacterium]
MAALEFHVPGREPSRLDRISLLPGEVDVGDVLLRRCTELSGRCLDDSGRPVAGVSVQMMRLDREDLDPLGWPNDGRGSQSYLFCGGLGRGHATTDADGRFTFRELPPGTCDLDFEHGLFRSARLGGVPVGIEGCSVGDVQLTAARSLSGRIVDADGHPAAHVRVYARSESGWERFQRGGLTHSARVESSAEADDDGRFVIGGLAPGDFKLQVDTSWASAAIEWSGPFPAGTTGIELALKCRMPLPAVPAPQVVQTPRREPPASLSGRVIDADGSPLAGAEVSVHGSCVVTDADGRFVLKNLSRSDYALSAWRKGRMYLVTKTFHVDGDMQGLLLRMSSAGSLRATFGVDPGSNPSATTVELVCVNSQAATSVTRDGGPPLAATYFTDLARPNWGDAGRHPNGDGSIDWPALVPGDYELHARAVSENFLRLDEPGATVLPAAAVVQPVTLLPGQATDVSVRMPAAGQLAGRVYLDGVPVEGAEVVAAVGRAWSNERVAATRSGWAGEWALDGLPPAHYQVVFHVPHGYMPLSIETNVVAGQRAGGSADIEARFMGHPLEGHVLRAPDGVPVAGVEMNLLPPVLGWCGVRDPSQMDWRRLGGAFAEPVVTDEAGRFRFEHIPDGLYEVCAETPDLRAEAATIVLLPWSEDGPRGVLAFGGPRELHDPLRLELRLEPLLPKQVVRGHVFWADGVTPFTAAAVSVEGNGDPMDRHVRAEAPGQFEVWLDRPGDYSLVVLDGSCQYHEVLRRPISVRAGETLDLALVVP